MQGKWIRKPQGDASAIFVHGMLSKGETHWLNENGTYSPELLKNEPELSSRGIYVFTYQTGIFSGTYRVSDVVDALKEHMGLDWCSRQSVCFRLPQLGRDSCSKIPRLTSSGLGYVAGARSDLSP